MKIKYILIIILVGLCGISISQIFSIPPYEKDVYNIYKSGYFSELEKSFDIIKESFIEIKMMSKPAYAWIFLEDIRKKYKMVIRVYNSRGIEVTAPGQEGKRRDPRVIKVLNSLDKKMYSEISIDKYYSALPVFLENRCSFCHNTQNRKKIVGVLTFERSYSSHIYYSSERIIIFILISAAIALLLFFVIRWDPAGAARELFDKN
ncbi:MAG: hypothetical protein MUC95_01750 [Spirochaetes bacterium]|nr:hypothetical protein [Spirochaetota bacterium]